MPTSKQPESPVLDPPAIDSHVAAVNAYDNLTLTCEKLEVLLSAIEHADDRSDSAVLAGLVFEQIQHIRAQAEALLRMKQIGGAR